MYFAYGSFKHPIGQVAISSDQRDRVRSPRGRLQSIRRTLSITGTIIESGQSDITAAIKRLTDGYLIDGAGAGLFQTDGKPSAHYLPSAGSLYGVQVLNGPNFSDTMGQGEYATGRSFSVTLQAEYPVPGADPLLEYSETITIKGTGGPRRVVTEVDFGYPVTEITRQRTAVVVTQQGQAVGYLSPITPNAPMFPQYMSAPDHTISIGTAKKQHFLRSTDYPTAWSYQFILPDNPGIVYPIQR